MSESEYPDQYIVEADVTYRKISWHTPHRFLARHWFNFMIRTMRTNLWS